MSPMDELSLIRIRLALQDLNATFTYALDHDRIDELVDLFTEDADYVEHSFGRFKGREAIYDWVTGIMAPPAGKVWGSFPVRWHFVDEEKGWILCCFINRMADLGDGIVREVDNWSLLKYAGNDQWSYEEDIYNMAEFRDAIVQWHEIKAASKSAG